MIRSNNILVFERVAAGRVRKLPPNMPTGLNGFSKQLINFAQDFVGDVINYSLTLPLWWCNLLSAVLRLWLFGIIPLSLMGIWALAFFHIKHDAHWITFLLQSGCQAMLGFVCIRLVYFVLNYLECQLKKTLHRT